MDGYAVLASETPVGEYQVLTAIDLARRASVTGEGKVRKGEVFRINTGQGLPLGTDSVVMVEDTLLVSSMESDQLGGGEEVAIKVLAQVDQGENVRGKGSDVKEGAVVLRKGTAISSLGGEIGTLAFVGRKEVSKDECSREKARNLTALKHSGSLYRSWFIVNQKLRFFLLETSW